ncbi:hypothetical protein ACIP2X_06830 [Streptomyces sp. NPDC089424]|uniref:hypothetical protein n=1 Tax=Streptomyces sp. NPDC089424 TaxID=3365917 RepID=UPI0037F4990E
MSTGKDEPGTEVEILRAVLLDRPADLPAPPDRMAAVRNRFRRTRRLRVAATAVPLVLLAAVFVPQQLGPGRTAEVAGPAAEPSFSPGAASLQNLYGLQMPVPPDWSELTVPSHRAGASPVRFISTGRLDMPGETCPDLRADDWTDPACLPNSGRDLGALVAFQVEEDPAAAVEAGRDTEARAVAASPACRSLSGTTMYKVQRSVGTGHPNAVITGMACVGEVSTETHSKLMSILDKAVLP